MAVPSRALTGPGADAAPPPPLQGLDTAHKQRVAEVLGDPEGSEKRRSRESLTADSVKYESGPDGGEEVSMGVEWSGVSTVRAPQPCLPWARPLPRVPAELVHASPPAHAGACVLPARPHPLGSL